MRNCMEIITAFVIQLSGEISLFDTKFTMQCTIKLALLFQIIFRSANALFPCNNTSTCVENLWIGSECIDGACTNPYQIGCLHSTLGTEGRFTKLRTCNSEDPEDAVGVVCSPPDPDFNHMEIRIMSQNWESAFFEAWILQIILSEMLGVPTTIETNLPNVDVNFYHPQNSFQYGKPNIWGALREAKKHGGDCTKADKSLESYTPCSHVVPEVWKGGYFEHLKEYRAEGVIEPTEGMGAIGQLVWFVPKYVVERNPSVVYFKGLAGKNKRKKLARFFKRPTSWIDYCTEVSTSNCSKSDGVAERAPENENEKDKYFVPGFYTGHFRITPEGDCALNSETCTGHIANFPCHWQSHVEQQAYHNNIALKSSGPLETGGYSYSQLTQIWAAANATKSNVIMYWWTPDLLYQKYLGTEAEFTKVILPPPTQKCIDARSHVDRCTCDPSDADALEGNEQCDYMKKVGKPEGGCDDEAQALQKVVAKVLQQNTYAAEEVMRSPAYEVIKAFSISELEIAKIFGYWQERKVDEWGFDPRQAVCRWAIENLDDLESFIPISHPRIIQHQNIHKRPLFHFELAAGCLATFMVVVSGIYIHLKRDRKILRYAQIEFLFLLLSGLMMVSLGSILLALQPTDAMCTAVAWFLTLGYTLELIPLIVKVAAMNRLMNAAKKFKRIRLNRKNLFVTVLAFAIVVLLFLIIWTVLDPPHKSTQLILSNEVDPTNNATIVKRYVYCQSNSQAWRYISAGWHCIMLICATVLAYQTRNMRQGFNESQVLVLMIYSHFFFVILRLITFVLENVTSLENVFEGYRSLIYSFDAIMTIMIYFFPKFVANDDNLDSGKVQDTRTWLVRQITKTTKTVRGKPTRTTVTATTEQGPEPQSNWNLQNSDNASANISALIACRNERLSGSQRSSGVQIETIQGGIKSVNPKGFPNDATAEPTDIDDFDGLCKYCGQYKWTEQGQIEGKV